jgi:hypothetical protein
MSEENIEDLVAAAERLGLPTTKQQAIMKRHEVNLQLLDELHALVNDEVVWGRLQTPYELRDAGEVWLGKFRLKKELLIDTLKTQIIMDERELIALGAAEEVEREKDSND